MILLLEELKINIEDELKGVTVRKKSKIEEYSKVPVYLWDLPKTKDLNGEYPYVLIQGFKGEFTREQKFVNVRFIIGIYNHEKNEDVAVAIGEDLSNVINRVAKAVIRPEKVYEYNLEFPVTFEVGLSEQLNFQPLPLGLAQINTTWQRALTIRREDSIQC